MFSEAEDLLPLASLRLLVPPLQLLSASMWKILKQKDVMSFWKVSEFVSVVMETVPELLLFKHWTQLTLGLRARFILELCQRGEDQELIISHLESMKQQQSTLHEELSDEDRAGDDIGELIHSLLKDNQERQVFFQEVWCEEQWHRFDTDLQTLFWEFLCRLNQLLPVPELEQSVLWLGESSVLEDFLPCLSEPTHMKNLLHHHKKLGHLEQHVPPSSMGDHISSCLSAASQNRPSKLESKCDLDTESDPPPASNEDLQPQEDAAMEIFTVTECTEIELTATATDVQVVVIDDATHDRPIREETEDVGAMEENSGSAILKDGFHVTAPDIELVFIDNTASNGAIEEETVIASNENVSNGQDEAMEESNAAAILKDQSEVMERKRAPGPHDCPDCDKKFKFASFLVAHRVIHTGERPHRCSECGQCFSFRQSLERHRHTHKTGRRSEDKQTPNEEGVVNGNEEGAEVAKPSEPLDEQSEKAKGEFKTSANQAIDAQLMDDVISLVQVRTSRRKRKATKKMRSLQKKLERQKEAEKAKEALTKTVTKTKQPKKSSDHSYGTTMTSSKQVHKGEDPTQQHLKESHPNRPDSEKRQTPEATEGHKTVGSFKCSVCGELFKSLKDRKDHIASTHMQNGVYFCGRCGKNYTWRGAFIRHVRMYCSEGGANGFACSHCELVFDCASTLFSHIQARHEEKVHVCNCGKSFPYKAALTAHQRTHQKQRPHVCDQCGKGFLYKGGLLGHMKIHSQEMPFSCSHCGKGFKRERNMKKHERCHTREDVFKCSQCDKTFVYKATLTRHELTHTGERPFLCSDCGKGFFSHAELLKHERFHTGHKPFECGDCGKRFTQSCYLTIHRRYHTGAKPYACGDCEKSFLSANRLKRHQRTHTGEKPYVCDECGKGFRQSYHLKMHQRTHVIDLT